MKRRTKHSGLCFAGMFALVVVGCTPEPVAPRRAAPPQTGAAPTETQAPPAQAHPVPREGDAVSTPTGDTAMSLTVQSPAFVNDAAIPKRFTGDGEDVSPQLTWSGIPPNAKELALIMDDPDAPTPEPWVHWVIYKIPAGTAGLPENVAKTAKLTTPAGTLQGKNSWGKESYGGPSPPRGHGTHRYHFKLYALDAVSSVSSGLTKAQLLAAMKGHIVAQGELVGTYQR